MRACIRVALLPLQLFILVGTVAVAAAATPTVPTLLWSDCGDGLECATADVPLDYRHPTGTMITLPLIRKVATGPGPRIGSLFLNFGGPGVSGVDFLRQIAPSLCDFNPRFDLVSFDPRGTGGANPAIHCDAPSLAVLFDVPDVTTHAGLLQAFKDGRAYAGRCRTNTGKLLRHVSTADVARDLDLLRQAVGDAQLSYAGYSYGTEIGAQYVTLFPKHARAVALDSALDHELWVHDPLAWDLDLLRASENALHAFFAFCSADPPSCPFAGADPEAAYDALLVQYATAPVPFGGYLVNDTPLRWATLAAMPSSTNFPRLAYALTLAQGGDPSEVLSLAAEIGLDQGDAFTVIKANDGRVPRGLRAGEQYVSAAFSAAPHLAKLFAFQVASDRALPTGAKAYRGPVKNAADAAPVLIVGAIGDTRTPYSEALALEGDLVNARLLTYTGIQHVSSAVSQCVRAAVTAYLVDGILPPPYTVCNDSPSQPCL